MSIGDILHQEQIRELISRLQQFGPQEYASTTWFKQDEQLQTLNMQLHVNAVMKNDQFILEECITHDKFKLLIYDLILTASWKSGMFPLLEPKAAELNSLKTYLALYHECVVCNMLEVLMYHRTAIDQSKEFLIEIVDYCYGKISKQVAKAMKMSNKSKRNKNSTTNSNVNTTTNSNVNTTTNGNVNTTTTTNTTTNTTATQQRIKAIIGRTPWQEIEQQRDEIQFSLFTMSLSILRYVTDYTQHLQIGIIHYILVECNIYALLVPLIEEKPWLRVNVNGDREVYEGGKWGVVSQGEYGRLPKIQAQVWITLYNLFMDRECRMKYELNDERKNTLLRVRKYLNEVVMDQIPALSYMLRSLEELSLMQVPTHLSTNPLVVQQIPLLGQRLRAIKWTDTWQVYYERLSRTMEKGEREQIGRLAQLYSNSNVQGLLEGFKCGKCMKQAYKRCAKCKNMWYCSRECQVEHWSTHRGECKKSQQPTIQKKQQQPTIQKKQQQNTIQKKQQQPTVEKKQKQNTIQKKQQQPTIQKKQQENTIDELD